MSPGRWTATNSVAIAGVACLLLLDTLAMPAAGQSPVPPTYFLTDVDPAPVVDSDDKGDDPLTDKQRITQLEQRIAELSEKVEAAAKPPPPAPPTAKPDDGWVDFSTERWNVRLGGHVQMDYVLWATASPEIVGDENYVQFRRLRLLAEGTGYGVYDFRLQMTLEPEIVTQGGTGSDFADPAVKDAYFSINEIPGVGRLRLGHFFVPFGLEQVTNDTFNVFLERSIPTQGIFTADREVGAAIYNATDDQSLSWATGVFFDNISEALKLRISDKQGYRVSGRVNWIPYFDEPTNGRYVIHTGAGVLHTNPADDVVRFRARPQVKEGPRLIDSGLIPTASYTIGNLEGAIVYGNFTVQSEAYLAGVDALDRPSFNATGAYVHMSYFLTGESRAYERFGQHGAQFGRNVPFTNVFAVPGCFGLGAWELKARWSQLNLNDINRGHYNDFTFGFNWYWSDRVRFMFDWIHPITSSDAVFGPVDADLLGARFDFNW
jgi:phosphate-selective porin OprO and OprP